MTFFLEAAAQFEADNLDDAMTRLAAHFGRFGDAARISELIAVSAFDKDNGDDPLEFFGEIRLDPIK